MMAKAGIASAFVTGVTLATVMTLSIWLRVQDAKSRKVDLLHDQATNAKAKLDTSRTSELSSSNSVVVELSAKADPVEMSA